MSQKKWTKTGPGGGGAMFFPTISPFDDRHMFLCCDMSGLYVTRDAGENWKQLSLDGGSSWVAFDPEREGVAYACATGLYRTRDGGDHWKLIFPNKEDFTPRRAHSEGSRSLLARGAWPGGSVTRVAPVSVAGEQRLYILLTRPPYLADSGPGTRLMESRDDGESFTEIAFLPGRHARMLAALDGILYAATDERILTIDLATGAQKDMPLPDGADSLYYAEPGRRADNGKTVVYAMAVVPETSADAPGIPYWAAPNSKSQYAGVFTYEDGAWTERDYGTHAPVPGLNYAQYIAVPREHAECAYLAVFRYEDYHKRNKLEGMIKTQNAGETWEWVMAVTDELPENLGKGWLDLAYGYEWPEPPIGMAVSPCKPDVMMYTTLGTCARTDDGGKTFRQMYCRMFPSASSDTGWASATTGLDVTTCYGYHVDPHDANNRIISYTDIALSRSEDGGATWIHSIAGVPRQWHNTCYWTIYDPQIKGRVYSAWASKHDFPLPKMFRRGTFFKGNFGGVCVSDDGGKTWRPTLGADGTGLSVSGLILDERSPASARVLWAAMPGRGVFASRDGGLTWADHSAGLPENSYAYKLALAQNGDIYLIAMRALQPTDRKPTDEELAAWRTATWTAFPGDETLGGGMYVLRGGQGAWEALALPGNENAPFDISLDDEGAYVPFWPGEHIKWDAPGDEAQGGLYRLDQNGWRRLLPQEAYTFCVYADPQAKGRVYLSTFNHSVYRSDDFGATWKRLKGFTFRGPQRVSRDPLDPEMIYVPTFGSSVWHGPAEGDDSDDENWE